MQKRHKDRQLYFTEQSITTRKHVIPFINQSIEINNNTSVLEIGCGEGGNLVPFAELGCKMVGVDLNKNKINNAINFYADKKYKNKPQFITTDIYDWKTSEQFDIVMLRDVLEHIHNQEHFLNYVKKFLKPQGKLFLGFPPWQNPYGGHQQIFNSFTSRLPFIHLLPNLLYIGILKLAKEDPKEIKGAIEVKETRITIERFLKIVKKEKYKIEHADYYLFNPNYEIKFGLKPRKQLKIITKIPIIRNFLITTCYILLSTNQLEHKP